MTDEIWSHTEKSIKCQMKFVISILIGSNGVYLREFLSITNRKYMFYFSKSWEDNESNALTDGFFLFVCRQNVQNKPFAIRKTLTIWILVVYEVHCTERVENDAEFKCASYSSRLWRMDEAVCDEWWAYARLCDFGAHLYIFFFIKHDIATPI